MNLEELFIKLGYTKEEYEQIRCCYALNNFRDETLYKNVVRNYNFLLESGYTKEEVIKMTKTSPSIYGLSIGNMKQKIEDMISLGYSKEEVIKMTKTLPTIYGYSIENMKQKIEDIMSLGYSKEEVIKMTRSLPSIYGYSIENMKQKIEFYDSKNMHELAIINTKGLMQSIALSYARYMFYAERGIEITMANFKKLFICDKQFEKQYGITKQELLEKYKYEDYQKGESK